MSKSYYTYILPEKAHMLLEQIQDSGVMWDNWYKDKPSYFIMTRDILNLNDGGRLELTQGTPKPDAKLLTWQEFVDLCHKVGKYIRAAEAVNAVDNMSAEVEQSDYSIRLIVKGNSYWEKLP